MAPLPAESLAKRQFFQRLQNTANAQVVRYSKERSKPSKPVTLKRLGVAPARRIED